MKIYLSMMIMVFIGLLVTIVGMAFGNAHFWEEIHPLFGGTFIALIFGHLWWNRRVLKALFGRHLHKQENK